MDLISFIYFDEQAIDNLHSQLAPKIDSIKETTMKNNEKSISGKFGFTKIFNVGVDTALKTGKGTTVEKNIDVTFDQKAVKIIEHLANDKIPPLNGLIENGNIQNSKVLVFNESFVLNKIFENGKVIYDQHLGVNDNLLLLAINLLKNFRRIVQIP